MVHGVFFFGVVIQHQRSRGSRIMIASLDGGVQTSVVVASISPWIALEYGQIMGAASISARLARAPAFSGRRSE
jgi:hypothetical protein